MTLDQARRLLDGIRRGTSAAPLYTINRALELTGDLPSAEDEDERVTAWRQLAAELTSDAEDE